MIKSEHKEIEQEIFDIFKDLVRFWTPSGEEKTLANHIMDRYLSDGRWEVKTDDLHNIFATPVRYNGERIPLLNSHTDVYPGATSSDDIEVLTRVAANLQLGNDGWIVRGSDEAVQLGADDKIGCALCLWVAIYTDLPVKILLSSQEETGRVGVNFALEHNRPFFDNITFNLCLDRSSSDGNDIVFHYRDLVMCPDIMLERIEAISDETGYSMRRFASPRCADCYNIALAGIPSVNLSSGIYQEHTRLDRVNINQAVLTLEVVMRCVELNNALLTQEGDYSDISANGAIELEG